MYRRATRLLVALSALAATGLTPGVGQAQRFRRPMTIRPVHPYHAYWGCFGYCNGPLNPVRHHYWGCYGYCHGPLRPYWGCYGYCPGPIIPPTYGCYGYCPGPIYSPDYAPAASPTFDVPQVPS